MPEDVLIRDYNLHLDRLGALHAWLVVLGRNPAARKLYGQLALDMLVVGVEYLEANLTTMREQWRMQ